MRLFVSIGAALALGAIGLCAASLSACSPETSPPPAASATLTISDGWAAITPGGAKVAAGYLTVTNPGAADDRLLSASSPRAAHVEIHDSAMQDGMTTMQPMQGGLRIPPGASASLKPGAGHLMFIDITAPFVAGDSIPVTLNFEKAGPVETALSVRAPHDGG